MCVSLKKHPRHTFQIRTLKVQSVPTVSRMPPGKQQFDLDSLYFCKPALSSELLDLILQLHRDQCMTGDYWDAGIDSFESEITNRSRGPIGGGAA